MPWTEHRSRPPIEFPWSRTQSLGAAHTGTILQLNGQTGRHTLSANATPITSDGTQSGVLVTFDNLTTIEKQLMMIEQENSELHSLIKSRQVDPELAERFLEVVSSIDRDRESALPVADQAVALKIGLQFDKLAAALDRTDFETLVATASRLEQTASEFGIARIADVAGQLKQAVTAGKDNYEIMHLTMELLGECRATQNSQLQQFDQASTPKPQSGDRSTGDRTPLEAVAVS